MNTELEYIKENYGKMKAKEIAGHLDISIHRVYNLAKKHKLTKTLNPTFEISPLQEQILISGKIGDGNFKKNGSNYYYRETHAITEKDYLLWKYNQLLNLTTQRTYNSEARGVNQNPQIGFQTRNSPSFTKYVEMSKLECINHLDKLGLILLALDDGWCKRYTHSFGYYISIANLDEEEAEALISRFKTEFSIECSLIPSSGGAISIKRKESPKLLKGILEHLPKDMDIIQRKFKEFAI